MDTARLADLADAYERAAIMVNLEGMTEADAARVAKVPVAVLSRMMAELATEGRVDFREWARHGTAKEYALAVIVSGRTRAAAAVESGLSLGTINNMVALERARGLKIDVREAGRPMLTNTATGLELVRNGMGVGTAARKAGIPEGRLWKALARERAAGRMPARGAPATGPRGASERMARALALVRDGETKMGAARQCGVSVTGIYAALRREPPAAATEADNGTF